jgi:branched-subunit amino acid aminotransferase/4-amino-4-deoxychorismate lyase
MSLFSHWNGKIVKNEEICISPDNRSFKYGDGCFETIKVVDGVVLLPDLHFQRLFSSLTTLKFSIPSFFTADYIKSEIANLVKLNQHEKSARVRLVAYRGDGGLYDLENKNVNFIIQSWPGRTETNYYNETGLRINIFNDAKKTADMFSSIKSNNYLAYAMGAIWAKENGLDDCILTNAFNRIADATIANVFIVTGGIIKTPLLSEGCVNGVMRRYLLTCLQKESIAYLETEISCEELMSASEIFLTNANYGIRWVQNIEDKNYDNIASSQLYKKFITPLFNQSTF